MIDKSKISGLKITAYVVSLFFTVAILFPLLYMISSAIKDDLAIFDSTPGIIPKSPNSVTIVADYSGLKGESRDNVFEKLNKDCITVMVSTIYDFNRSLIGDIKFCGTMNGKTIFYARAHKAFLRLEMDFGLYASMSISPKAIIYQDKHKALLKEIGYSFDMDGINKKYDIQNSDKNEMSEQLANNFSGKFKLEGNFAGSKAEPDFLLVFENFIYYLKAPSYAFGNTNDFVRKYSFFAFFFNTLLGLVIAISTQVGLCALTAYPLSKLFSKKTADTLLIVFLGTLMIPFISIFIPQIKILQGLGISGGYLAMFLPYLYPSAFFIFLYKGFFDRLPASLFDAAKMDGAPEWYIFTKICIPLSKPVVAIIAMNTFVNEWANFFWYFVVANNSPKNWTMNLAIYELSINPTIKQNILMGLSVIALLPIIFITFLFADKIRESVVMSGIKE